MVFGNNHVTVKHDDFELTFGAYEAISVIDTSSTSSEKIKVAYSEEWTRKRLECEGKCLKIFLLISI